MISLAEQVAATIADHVDNNADDWERDDGTVRVTARSKSSITLSLFATDENGETTDKELDRVTIQTMTHVL